MPKFSVIIPVFNASLILRRCLDSVLSQDFIDFEVVCVDDGSTDTSLALLEEYAAADSRVRCCLQANGGPSKARNRGLDEALGEWVLFVDADDFFCGKTCLSVLAATISSKPRCELVYFAGRVAIDGQTYDNRLSPMVYDFGYQCLEDNCLMKMNVVFGSVYTQCYKKSIIDKTRLRFDESIWYAEDRLFVCSYFLYAGLTIVSPEVLYTYVSNDGSLMHDEARLARMSADQRKAMVKIEMLMRDKKLRLRCLKKYIHGLYIQGIDRLGRNEIDWGFVFRNASTVKLKAKDILLFLGINIY